MDEPPIAAPRDGIGHSPAAAPVSPMSGVPLFILMSLASGEKHGHALMKDIERFAGVRLGPGTLYKAIGRLESEGLIDPLAPEDRRRPYALTAVGKSTLAVSIDYLEQVTQEGRARLGMLGPRGPSVAGAGGASG